MPSESVNRWIFSFMFLTSAAWATIPEYFLLGDIHFSPYAGGEDLLFAVRSCERVEGLLLRKTTLESSRDLQSRSWRLSELIAVWLPLNYEAMLVQHEVFGHGYRIRDIHSDRAKVTGYQFDPPPPYGSGGAATSYLLSEQLTSTEETAISSAGVEATAILANLTKWKWLIPRSVDARQAILYLLSQHDLTFYISSLKAVNHRELSGHDIHEYLFWLNTTYPDQRLKRSRLRSLALMNWLDPFTFYALYSALRFIASGRDTHIPMISIQKVGYLFGARLGLTPFGPEFFWEHYFSFKNQLYYGYLKAGRHAYNNYFGLGCFLPLLGTIKQWNIGLRLDLWWQPKLLLTPGTVSILEIDQLTSFLYPSSERHAMNAGLSLSTLLSYHWKQIGCEIELGAKTRGFLPGYSLVGAPTIRGGLSAQF